MHHDQDHDEDQDDLAAWLEMIRSVTPLVRRNEVVPPENRPRKFSLKTIGHRKTQEESFAALLSARPAPGTPSPLPQRQVKKMRQKQIPVEACLDLHGLYVEQARLRVTQFLQQAVLQDMRHLEIVTGRGNPEQGTGQLRRLVPLWLREPPFDALVLHIEPNPMTQGGSLLVLLRRNKARH